MESTAAERALVDAALVNAFEPSKFTAARLASACVAVYDERVGASKPEAPRAGVPNDNASVGACPCVCERPYLRQRIAELEAQLAEATRLKASVSVRHEATWIADNANPNKWAVQRKTRAHRTETVLWLDGEAAESIAREHAARLNAEVGDG